MTISEEEIQFAKKSLWRHKDGSEQLLVSMNTQQLKNILKEAFKRSSQKIQGAALFNEKIEHIYTILHQRGEKMPATTWSKLAEYNSNPTIEQACNLIYANINPENQHLFLDLCKRIKHKIYETS